jgi:hypothetical protein
MACASAAAIVEPVLANEDRLHRRLHVFVGAATTRAFEQGERPIVGVERHLLGLARIGLYEQQAAVTVPDMGDLHDRRAQPRFETGRMVAALQKTGELNNTLQM